MVVIYSLKPATFDLFGYSVYFDTGYWPYASYSVGPDGLNAEDIYGGDEAGVPYFDKFSNEWGFTLTTKWFSDLLPHGQFLPRLRALGQEYTSDSLILVVISIGVLSFVITAWNFLSNKLRHQNKWNFFLASVPIVLGSLFLFIGSQNVIRQFLMLSLCTLAISCFGRRRYVFAVIASIASITMHHWGWVFVGLGLSLLFLQKVTPVKNSEIQPLTLLPTDYLGFVIGLLIVFSIKVLASSGFYEFSYVVVVPDWQEEFRTLSSTKIIALLFVMIISELAAGKTRINDAMDIRQMRRLTFFFIAPLIVLPEIFSRAYFFFFAIEAIYIVWALTQDIKRVRLSGVLVFSTYAIAPNALNVLVGKGWQEIIWLIR
jgi:hypothetical protein